jgi:hypothetical protein
MHVVKVSTGLVVPVTVLMGHYPRLRFQVLHVVHQNCKTILTGGASRECMLPWYACILSIRTIICAYHPLKKVDAVA